MLTRLAASAAALVLLPTLAACGGSSSSSTAADPASSSAPTTGGSASSAGSTTCDYPTDPEGAAKKVDPPPATPTVSGKVPVTFETSVGNFGATLDATKAPCTVNSFVSLAKQGYFDDTPCHRLTTSTIYVLQCGDPTGLGSGGPGYTIPDEFSPTDTYGPGTLAMANRDKVPNSGGSQFFVVYRDTPLPPTYTVFGHIDAAGLADMQKVAAKGSDNANAPGDGHPLTPVKITQVTTG